MPRTVFLTNGVPAPLLAPRGDFWAWDGPPVRRLQASLHKKRAPARRQYAELYGREAWHWDENC